MRYAFKCRITVMDCWILYMQRIYHSMVGVVSAVLGISLIGLLIRFWSESSWMIRILLCLGALLVPVVQPLGVYLRSKKQVKAIPEDLEMKFTDKEIFVTTGGKSETIPWSKMRYVLKERNMVTLVTNSGSGYMLTNSALGEEREAFCQFASSCISK